MLDALPHPIFDDSDREPTAAQTPAGTEGDLLDAYSRAVAGVAETVGPTVVRVDTLRRGAKAAVSDEACRSMQSVSDVSVTSR